MSRTEYHMMWNSWALGWFLAFCNATMLAVNFYNWRHLCKMRERCRIYMQEQPIRRNDIAQIYENAHAFREEARKLRDEWKFAKMLSDANHDQR